MINNESQQLGDMRQDLSFTELALVQTKAERDAARSQATKLAAALRKLVAQYESGGMDFGQVEECKAQLAVYEADKDGRAAQ